MPCRQASNIARERPLLAGKPRMRVVDHWRLAGKNDPTVRYQFRACPQAPNGHPRPIFPSRQAPNGGRDRSRLAGKAPEAFNDLANSFRLLSRVPGLPARRKRSRVTDSLPASKDRSRSMISACWQGWNGCQRSRIARDTGTRCFRVQARCLPEGSVPRQDGTARRSAGDHLLRNAVDFARRLSGRACGSVLGRSRNMAPLALGARSIAFAFATPRAPIRLAIAPQPSP